MGKRKAITKKIAPELEEWLKQRQENLQKFLPYGHLTQIETQRIIARTSGVEVTKEMIRRVKKIEK